jgi:hypothetical protein
MDGYTNTSTHLYKKKTLDKIIKDMEGTPQNVLVIPCMRLMNGFLRVPIKWLRMYSSSKNLRAEDMSEGVCEDAFWAISFCEKELVMLIFL